MGKNIDRELPVVTGLGTFIGSNVQDMAHLNTPLGRGIQFGVGRGEMPISNFPDDHTQHRPWWGEEKMPKISVGELLISLAQDINGRIARVTVKAERETDQKALLDVVQGVREQLSMAEIVVASHYLSVLEKVRDGDVKPDVLQQLIPEFRHSVRYVIWKDLNWSTISSGSEVSFPFPNIDYPSSHGEIESISLMLADNGHDSYVNLVETQGQVGDFVKASSMFNFGQRCRAENEKSGAKRPEAKHKLRGFYVKGVPHGLKLTWSDVNLASLGEGLWADKNVEERATK